VYIELFFLIQRKPVPITRSHVSQVGLVSLPAPGSHSPASISMAPSACGIPHQWALESGFSLLAPSSQDSSAYKCFITFPDQILFDHKKRTICCLSILLMGLFIFFFKTFNESIGGVSRKLTFCTLTLYKNIVQDLPPTPSKFHYIFNLRDLSRVFNGLVLTNPDR
jgi:hypothetical protein